MKKYTVLMLLALMVPVAIAAYTYSASFTNTGTIVVLNAELKLFSDAAGTVPLTSVTWGPLHQGETITKTFYIKNTGNVALTLSAVFNNWNPVGASTYIMVSWNREAFSLAAGAITPFTVTQVVSPSITGISTYAYTMVINGVSP